MASSLKNLSFVEGALPSAKPFRFGIVVSEWNTEITSALLRGAYTNLVHAGAEPENITQVNVPGSYELTAGAHYLAKKKTFDAIICLGCVIQGETKHFDFICSAVANGLTNLSLQYGIPVIFGVLTTNNLQQAQARAGGKHGNKGDEAAITAIKMAALLANP